MNRKTCKDSNRYFLRIFPCMVIAIALPLCLIFIETNKDVFAQTDNQHSIPIVLKNIAENKTSLLGDPFYTESTKSTNLRIVSIDPTPLVEVTYTGNSSIKGSSTQTIGTIVDTMGNDGSIHSQGKAIILTSAGQIITYKSQSIGHYEQDGSFSDKGTIMFNTPFNHTKIDYKSINNSSNISSYADFSGVLGIYEKSVDPHGNGFTKVWKWG